LVNCQPNEIKAHAKTPRTMKRFFGITKQVVVVALVAWVLACFAQFPLSTMVEVFGSPRWLPLPLSQLGDFVELPDGRTYLSLGFFSRVLCYDKYGHFVASYPVPETKHGVQLAVDKTGRLYYWALGKIFLVGADWRVSELTGDPECNSWYLNEDYHPTCRSRERHQERILDRPVKPGEVMFVSHSNPRIVFACNDGSMLERDGNSIIRRAQQGGILGIIATPWYLIWAVFPFPAMLALPTMLLLILARSRKGSRNQPVDAGQ
jgi:hypothetical protein